jgi:hypothetical protein
LTLALRKSMQCTIDVQSLLHVETSFHSHFLELEISKVCMGTRPHACELQYFVSQLSGNCSPRVCENLNVHTLSVCCISKSEPYMLCCRSSVITHFNKHMSCILRQVVELLTIWVQWTHQRAKWMDDRKTYYQATRRGDKPTGTRKPANANPESSMVFFVKLTSYKIQTEVSFNRIANLKTRDIRWHSQAIEKGNQGMRFLDCQTKWFQNWTQEETSGNLSKVSY